MQHHSLFSCLSRVARAIGWPAVLLLLCALPATMARAQTNLESQRTALQRVNQALTRVVRKAKSVTAQSKFGFNPGGCVYGAMLSPGANVSETFSLQAGVDYIFGSGGDDSTRNVDVFISDSAGRVIEKDTESDPFAVVVFTPKKSGKYKMTLKLASSQSGKAFCAVVVLRKGGVNLPIEALQQAGNKMASVATIVFVASKGGQFNQDSNTWALYGAVLGSKQTAQSDYKSYDARNRVFVAVGDSRVKDLDLRLLDANHKVVATDTKNGTGAGLAYQTKAAKYAINFRNNYSTSPALALGILLDLPAGVDIDKALEELARQNPNVPNAGATTESLSGNWRGQWADNDGMQGGTLQLNIGNNGSINGQLYNAAVNATVPVAGQVKSDGSFFFKYSFGGMNYIAKGQMGIDDDDNLIGQAGFSIDGQNFFSSGRFQLQQ